MGVIDLITLLIFLAAVFTLLNITVLKLPSTIGLMAIALMSSIIIVGLGFIFPSILNGASHIVEEFDFKEVLLNVMLNFLLFAGALSVDLSKLLEERLPVIVLATLGTLLSTFIVGYLMFYAFPLIDVEVPLIFCLLFGALISPTDPIAVLALVKKFGVSKNLEIKIAGESLFNDGVGVVIFLTIMGVASATYDLGSGHGHGEEVTALSVAWLFIKEVAGGVLIIGAGFGYLGFRLLNYIDNDHVELEVLVTLGLVMLGGRLAELIHVSGPLGMVVMGLFIGNEGRSEHLANATGEYVYKFWHLLDEALNAILFILIGLEVIVIAHDFKMEYLTVAPIAIGVVLIARFLGVSIPIIALEKIMRKKFEEKSIIILTWGGLRGGISVALALSLSDAIPGKDVIVAATYAVVVFSILVQGLTIERVIKS